MRMVARLKPHERYARPWQDGLRSWADQTLCAAYIKILLQLLAGHPHSSYSEVCARKGDIVAQCDPGARVDIAIDEALVGAGGDALILEHILKCLPDTDLERSLEHSQQLLEQLREKEIYKVVSKRAQAILQATLEAVASMRTGPAPTKAVLLHDPLPTIWLRLQYFVSAKQKDKSGAFSTIFGSESLKIELAELGKAPHIQLSNLDKFHVFSWILDDNEMAQVGEFTNKALSEVSNATSTRMRAKTSRAAPPDDKEAKKQKVEIDGIMSLFG